MKPAAPLFHFKLGTFLLWVLGLVWILAILTADFRDPTIFNPLYPADGFYNWLSLPGALLGGSLVELFGPIALLIPWMVVRIILCPAGTISRWRLVYYALTLLVAFNTVYASLDIALGSVEQTTSFLEKPGYLGVISLVWLESSLGSIGGLFLCGVLMVYSSLHLVQILSPLDLFQSLHISFRQLILVSNQKKGPGTRLNPRGSLTKKGPLIFQTRTSSNAKMNHPLEQMDEV